MEGRSTSLNHFLSRNGSSSVSKYELRKKPVKKQHLTLDEKICRKDRKRKRFKNANEKMENIIQNIQKEIEQQLDPETEENDFLATDKEAILKVLIMDEQIKDMVRKTLHPGHNTCYEPKLTRAKVRELLKLRPDLFLPMPIQTKNSNFVSECLLLIQEDYSDNSSEDEEYRPEDDEFDDEDDDDKSEYADSLLTSEHDLNLSFNSVDLSHVSEITTLEENICHRTRSKLPLTETLLEDIERCFQPPDVTPDMYETEHDNEDWCNFIRDISNSRNITVSEHPDNDDDPEDPEYTIQADEEIVDREELRKDKDVEVPTNELNDLITEFLKNCESTFPMSPEPVANENLQIPDSSSVNNPVEKPTNRRPKIALPILPTLECPVMTNPQKLLLEQQLRQHVQLTLTHFLQCFKHPTLFMYANRMKLILESLQTLAGFNKKSTFYASNLDSALKLVRLWEDECKDKPTPKIILSLLTQKSKKPKVPTTFPPNLMKLMCKSDAFLYPLLLPSIPFSPYMRKAIHKRDMTESEEWLLSCGLEQFMEFVENNQNRINSSNTKWEALKLISEFVFSKQFTPSFLNRVILKRSADNSKDNCLSYYAKHKRAPPLKHYVIPVTSKPLCLQSPDLLPTVWKQYIEDNFIVTDSPRLKLPLVKKM